MGELEEILKPVNGDLEKFSEVFSGLLKSHVRTINIIARHMVRQRGKRIRPVLVLLSARICGTPTESTYKAAALIELLHNATLIHDDIVDGASVRRGRPSINAIWKNKVSVLMGDFVLARSLITAAGMSNLRVIDILSVASARMSQGEINQMVKSRKKDISEEEYFSIISDKTAALTSASCQLGAVSIGAEPEIVSVMSEFGEKVGLAFQIKDDLLDYAGNEKLFGKKRGSDLRDGKITLPLIFSLRQVGSSQRNFILKRVKKKAAREDINVVIQFMHEQGGLDYAQQKAEQLIAEAHRSLDIFPKSEYKTALQKLTGYFTERKK